MEQNLNKKDEQGVLIKCPATRGLTKMSCHGYTARPLKAENLL